MRRKQRRVCAFLEWQRLKASMKKAENNEMDLLLRSLARREGSLSRNSMIDGTVHSDHLDADGLISYAEQTLPAATRARYTIHLADCSQCRKIVAGLAPAVSVAVRDHPEEQGVTTFWQTVRHFLSLPVLRYAVPALGLFAIVVVGLVVFRGQRQPDMVAKNEPSTRQVAITQSPPSETPSQNKAGETEEAKGFHDSVSDLNAQRKAESNKQGQATGTGPGVSAPVVSEKESADKTAAVAQPTFAPEPPRPAPKPQDQVAEVQKEKDTRTETGARPQSSPAKEPGNERDANARYKERPAKEEIRVNAESRESQVAGRTAANTAADRDNLRRSRSLRGDTAGKKADDEAAETRAVAGRHFRKQGSLWIDTAYHSGLALTVISRGSEQYRALVADEPSIRTIAEQLQGEVILIWKGRGYRIR